MIGLVESLVWSAVIAYGLWLAGSIGRDVLAQRKMLADMGDTRASLDRMAMLERVREANKNAIELAAVQASKPAVKPSRGDITIPDDLVAYARTWGDEFAVKDTLEEMKYRFLQMHTGDSQATWQAVRRSYEIGEMP